MEPLEIQGKHDCSQCCEIASMYHKRLMKYNDISTTEIQKLKLKKEMKDIIDLIKLITKG